MLVYNDSVAAHGADDVLNRMLADVLEDKFRLALDLTIGILRHGNSAGLRQVFQPNSHIHAVAVDCAVFLFEHISQVYADAEQHPAAFRRVGVTLHKVTLYAHRAAHHHDNARKRRQHTVASGIDETATVIGNMLAKDVAADIKHFHCGPFIVTH